MRFEIERKHNLIIVEASAEPHSKINYKIGAQAILKDCLDSG